MQIPVINQIMQNFAISCVLSQSAFLSSLLSPTVGQHTSLAHKSKQTSVALKIRWLLIFTLDDLEI